VRASALVDTGPIVALVDPDDRWHAACVSQLKTLRLPVATSAAVFAEVFHLVGEDRRAVTAAWGLVRSPATVLPIADSDMAPLAHALGCPRRESHSTYHKAQGERPVVPDEPVEEPVEGIVASKRN
jgi:predicted nucleic acid-binding protein